MQVLPELWLFPFGLIGAFITGLGMPAIALLMAQFVTVFYNGVPIVAGHTARIAIVHT